jgi:tripartite-type tricarboxylate transporter receptor subunit TctC
MIQQTPSHRSASPRRGALIGAMALTVVAGLAMTFFGAAQAQTTYPNRPIKLVVGFAAGGPSDIIARLVGASMSKTLGEQVYIENRAGASGNLATESVARAEPDGYTLLLTTFSGPVNESLTKIMKYITSDHFEPIASLAETGLVLLVHPSLQVKSTADLVAMAKAKPGEVLYATAGIGTATHLAAELFNMAAGIKMTPVHYKGGGETLKDLLSGQVKIMFSTIPPVLGFVKDGKLRGIATSGLKPDKALPDLKTIAQSGVAGYEVLLWSGLPAPKGTPKAIVDKLADAARKALDNPETLKSLTASGYTPLYMGPADFAKFYQDEVVKWSKVAAAINAQNK